VTVLAHLGALPVEELAPLLPAATTLLVALRLTFTRRRLG